MPVWHETHGPLADIAGFQANHSFCRPSRYWAASFGLQSAAAVCITDSRNPRNTTTRPSELRCIPHAPFDDAFVL